jgi:hypothetical protein
MKKVASFLIVFGSALAAFGFSGWQATVQPRFMLPGQSGPDWTFSAGWTQNNQLDIAIGIMLLACGVILRIDSK